jgi:hypothetical protein
LTLVVIRHVPSIDAITITGMSSAVYWNRMSRIHDWEARPVETIVAAPTPRLNGEASEVNPNPPRSRPKN